MKLPSVADAEVFSDSITIHATGTSETTTTTKIASDQPLYSRVRGLIAHSPPGAAPAPKPLMNTKAINATSRNSITETADTSPRLSRISMLELLSLQMDSVLCALLPKREMVAKRRD